jgi:hypothetical protein
MTFRTALHCNNSPHRRSRSRRRTLVEGEEHMRKLIGYVAGAAFGIAFVATCGNMKGNGSGDMGGGSPFDIAGLDIAGADAIGGGGSGTPGVHERVSNQGADSDRIRRRPVVRRLVRHHAEHAMLVQPRRR